MTLFAAKMISQTGAQLILAALLAAVGFTLLLPKPRMRSVAAGTAALVMAAAVLVVWLIHAFGQPSPDTITTTLFWLFSGGAVAFGTVLVVQKNPARGAISFAFVILSTCGLFLLLAAPFLMAATVIIYAGAIIVTFLFVLMLSHAQAQSDENDRTREPMLGSLAGFAFVGLVLFTLFQANATATPSPERLEGRLPVPVLTADEHDALTRAIASLRNYETLLGGDVSVARDEIDRGDDKYEVLQERINRVLDTARGRFHLVPDRPGNQTRPLREDPQAVTLLERTREAQKQSNQTFATIENKLVLANKPDPELVLADVRRLRESLQLLAGMAELPARNVGNLGFVLYADQLLAVELAGTLLLVATIGTVAIVRRRGVNEA